MLETKPGFDNSSGQWQPQKVFDHSKSEMMHILRIKLEQNLANHGFVKTHRWGVIEIILAQLCLELMFKALLQLFHYFVDLLVCKGLVFILQDEAQRIGLLSFG